MAKLTGPERVELYADRMAALRERAFASPIGNTGWCRDFDRFAQELRQTPFPAEFGFSVGAAK